MVNEVRQIVGIVLAIVGPFIFFSASNNPSFPNIALFGGKPGQTAASTGPDLNDLLHIDQYEVQQNSIPPEIHRLQDYLKIDTRQPAPDYGRAVEFLNNTILTLLPHAKVNTFEYVSGKPVVLVTLLGKAPSLPSILLNSHMDVVPVEESKWAADTPPLGARVVNGQVFARGAQDMKSVGLQYIEALKSLFEASWRPARTLHVLFVPDEEIGGRDGMREFTQSDLFPKLNVGFCLDEGEPSETERYNVFYGERRPWWFKITVTNAPGHGATFPEVTASTQLVDLVASRALKFRNTQLQLQAELGKSIGEIISVNIPFIDAGSDTAMNVIPSTATVGFDLRIPPTVSNQNMEKEIEKWITCDDGKVCPNTTIEFVNKVLENDVTSTDPSENVYMTPFNKAMQQVGIADVLDKGIFFASTDSRYLRAKGVPSIGFSPIRNTLNLMHKHNEFISVAGYMEGIVIYKALIQNLADFDPDRVAGQDEEPEESSPQTEAEEVDQQEDTILDDVAEEEEQKQQSDESDADEESGIEVQDGDDDPTPKNDL